MSQPRIGFKSVAVLLVVLVSEASAQTQSAPPKTLFELLNLDQSSSKEAKPPLRALVDPSGLEADWFHSEPSVKKGVEAEKQKIKAVRYLGSLSLCCHDEVSKAFYDILEDPIRSVRLEAAKAINKAMTRGEPCPNCQKRRQIPERLLQKIRERAKGKDALGRWLEPDKDTRRQLTEILRTAQKGS